MEILGIILAVVVIYFVSNGKRNSDPLNRKCAAELCEIFVSQEDISLEEIVYVFTSNARFHKQAGHVISMVPPLLIRGGYPKEFAMSTLPLLRAAQATLPK